LDYEIAPKRFRAFRSGLPTGSVSDRSRRLRNHENLAEGRRMSSQDILRRDISHLSSTKDYAVLLLHGLRSTPQELAYLAKSLAKQGFAVCAPYLEEAVAKAHRR
jgi:hypothetical protein